MRLCPKCLDLQKSVDTSRADSSVELNFRTLPAVGGAATEILESFSAKRKRKETDKTVANNRIATEAAQTAVGSAQKESDKAASQSQNAEVEATLLALHPVKFQGRKPAKKRAKKHQAAMDISSENMQDVWFGLFLDIQDGM